MLLHQYTLKLVRKRRVGYDPIIRTVIVSMFLKILYWIFFRELDLLYGELVYGGFRRTEGGYKR